MLLFKVKNTNIHICVFKNEINGKYEVTSCDSEGHEGLLADNLVSLKELHDLLVNVFDQKVICCGKFTNPRQVSKILGLDLA